MKTTILLILLVQSLACFAFRISSKARNGARSKVMKLLPDLASSLQLAADEGLNDLAISFPSIPVESLAAPGVAVVAGVFGLLKLTSYWKMQYMTASLVGGIPEGSSVVEIDATDGKNVFYLPKGVDFTAVMSAGEDTDVKKLKEKNRINEQLILECVGKANREGLKLQGKVRTKTQQIPGKSVDCVLSVGALSRSGSKGGINTSLFEVTNEAYRILRPGGLFLFIEPDSSGAILDTITKVFPKTITSDISAGDKARKAAQSKRDDLVDNNNKSNKKNKKPSKRGKGGFSSSAAGTSENVSTFAVEEEDSAGDDDSSSVVIKDDATSASAAAASDSVAETAAATADGSSKGPKTRPGITFEKVSNGIDPFVLGIAVRP